MDLLNVTLDSIHYPEFIETYLHHLKNLRSVDMFNINSKYLHITRYILVREKVIWMGNFIFLWKLAYLFTFISVNGLTTKEIT